MALFKGTVTRPLLDWYASKAQSAQQWFSQATPNYWVFSLQNNAQDGSTIYVYDARVISGAAFPAGTGNPGGNPNPTIGIPGSTGVAPNWQLISQHQDGNNNTTSFGVAFGGTAQAGELLIALILSENVPAAAIVPNDPTYILMAGADGNANSPCITVWAKVAIGTEGTSANFTLTGVGNSNYSGRGMRFTGTTPDQVLDAAAALVAPANSKNIIAPSITPSAPGDLIYCVWAATDGTGAIAGNPAFTLFPLSTTFGPQFQDGYMTLAKAGPTSTFAGTQPTSQGWSASSVAFRQSNNGNTPGQSLSTPIIVPGAVQPGLLNVNFSTSPLGITGVTKWMPPACDYWWKRDAPIAIMLPGNNFNLAGIAPENAAWCDLTWFSQK